MSRRIQCSACETMTLEPILDLGNIPVADAYEHTIEESVAAPTYPLDVAVCTQCYLIQLFEMLPQEQLFGTGYSFYASASPPLSAYHESYFEWVLKNFNISIEKKYVLEVGCNDGDLLRHFKNAGYKSIGVDPATGPVSVARTRGLEVYDKPFNSLFADEIKGTHGPAQLVVANHVLAHVENVSDFLYGLSKMIDKDGIIIVEVQYAADLLINNAFDLIYHEHRNFFSVSNLQLAAMRHGLMPVMVTNTNRQGGSIRLAFKLWDINLPDLVRVNGKLMTQDESVQPEKWLQTMHVYEGMQGRVDRIAERLRNLMHFSNGPGIVAGYAAPAKATTLLNFCDLTHELTHVVDTTIAKHGRYIPGTTAKIVAPNTLEDPDTYLLLAWNYAHDIIRANRSFAGSWIIPIPAPFMI